MFGDLDWPLNASRGLSATAEFLIKVNVRSHRTHVDRYNLYGVIHKGRPQKCSKNQSIPSRLSALGIPLPSCGRDEIRSERWLMNSNYQRVAAVGTSRTQSWLQAVSECYLSVYILPIPRTPQSTRCDLRAAISSACKIVTVFVTKYRTLLHVADVPTRWSPFPLSALGNTLPLRAEVLYGWPLSPCILCEHCWTLQLWGQPLCQVYRT